MYWHWKKGGLLLGSVFLLAVILVKPIGVSTQFVIFDAWLWQKIDNTVIVESETQKSGFESPNAYLNKSGGKYAKSANDPLNYSFVFVLCMLVGGFIGAITMKKPTEQRSQIPQCHRQRFGQSTLKRYVLAFLGGFLVLFGARLAGGCTSGHMMSGMMQTAMSGYVFAGAAFAFAVPTAILLYVNKGEKS